MRPLYSALGDIAGCAIATGDDIVRVIRESNPTEVGLTIASDGQWIVFVAQPHQEMVTALANYRLSSYDRYPISDFVDEADGTEAVGSVVDGRDLPQYEVRSLSFVPEGVDGDRFDGVQVRGHVYPFDEAFRVREYTTVRNDLRHYTPEIFQETIAELGYDLDAAEANASQIDMEEEQAEDSPAFQ